MSLEQEQPSLAPDSAPVNTPDTPLNTDSGTADPNQLTQEEIDEIEEELEGVKLKGKKDKIEEIKSGRLMQADYTRKTQEVADQKRAFESERQQFQQSVQIQQQFLTEIARVTAIDDRLSQFGHLDWQTLNAQDPQRAQALLIEFNQLQAQRGQLVGSLTQKQQQQALQQQQETARRLQEGRAVLERDIKGWGPQLAQKLTEYGMSVGIPSQVLANVTDPAFIKLLHKAYVGDQLEKQRLKPPELPKPAGRVSGGSASNAKPLSEITDPREWAQKRNERKGRTTK
jgi:hypothetical protein